MCFEILKKNKLWQFPLCIFIVAIIAFCTVDRVSSYILENSVSFKNIFWALAFGWSTFLALYAFQLHNRFYADNPRDILEGYGKLRWSQRIHQFILNFLGGLIGFLILYTFVYTDIFTSVEMWEKFVLLLVSFLGITGYLPYTVIIKNWLPR